MGVVIGALLSFLSSFLLDYFRGRREDRALERQAADDKRKERLALQESRYSDRKAAYLRFEQQVDKRFSRAARDEAEGEPSPADRGAEGWELSVVEEELLEVQLLSGAEAKGAAEDVADALHKFVLEYDGAGLREARERFRAAVRRELGVDEASPPGATNRPAPELSRGELRPDASPAQISKGQ
ncbi:hypothetical protein SAMN04489747_3475 [Auraticoccus monumenti]|uniref:Uncharacterized protein n=2 Tax=Auraticoccus monumenti TaxID=675864 RepID=A0A1G7D343_9ACTN|nr:hypothetical protein SAMN04489747_3475 [Auraticoccus monumenti]